MAANFVRRALLSALLPCLVAASGGDLHAEGTAQGRAAVDQKALADLGRQIFFDTNLSSPSGQSCASCHDPLAAFTDPRRQTPTSQGAVAGRFGSRNAMMAKYTGFIPPFQFDQTHNAFIGGLFWDGRAATLEAQAKGPFLNPLEMNNPDVATLINTVKASKYAPQFTALFGANALSDPSTAFDRVAAAIAAFERSPALAPFTSKFDAVQAGQQTFTAQEQRGRNLFFGRAGCAACHNSNPPPAPGAAPTTNRPQLFSNFSYENDGVPANPKNPFYTEDKSLNPAGTAFVDLGLGGVLKVASQDGKFRVPSLRNISLTGPYMHNGVFNTLEEVVNFYNTRDINPAFKPEVSRNVSRRGGIGNLHLSAQDVTDLTSFLRTLSDR